MGEVGILLVLMVIVCGSIALGWFVLFRKWWRKQKDKQIVEELWEASNDYDT